MAGSGVCPGLPRNALTGRSYSGINVLMLWGAVIEQGYPSQSWLTFRQALEAGGHVRKGEQGVTDFENQLNVAHDDAVMRAARVKRLLSGFSMSAAPPARTVRTVSRFVVTGEEAHAIEVRAAMVLVEYKYERTRVLAANVTYRLVRKGADIKLESKIVRLANCDDFLHGIGYLL